MKTPEIRWQCPSRETSPLPSGQAGEVILAMARVWARLPCPAVVTLKKIGEIQIQPDQMALVEDLSQAQCEDLEWFRLTRAAEQGWVGVTLNTCHALIRSVLGGTVPQLIRPLGPGERGVMAAMLVAGLRSLGLAHRLTVALEAGRPPTCGQRILLQGAIRGGDLDGRISFVGPWTWFSDGAGPRLPSIPTDDSVQAVLELGRTALAASDLRAAELGDAILFDGIPNPLPGRVWPVNLLVGSSWVPARLGPDGSLTLAGPRAPIQSTTAPLDEDGDWKAPRSAPVAQDLLSSMAPTELVAELGGIRLHRDELAELFKGASLDLGSRPADHVFLRVGGRLWAIGGLVSLGEPLAIRIEHFPAS